MQNCFFDIAFFQRQAVAVIQGVTAVVTASIPAVDETANYKALLECVFILNGEYLFVMEYYIILGFFSRWVYKAFCLTWIARGTEFTGAKLVLMWVLIYEIKSREQISYTEFK